VEGAHALLRYLRAEAVQERLGALGYEPIREAKPPTATVAPTD
jgi:hypothetical protein